MGITYLLTYSLTLFDNRPTMIVWISSFKAKDVITKVILLKQSINFKFKKIKNVCMVLVISKFVAVEFNV